MREIVAAGQDRAFRSVLAKLGLADVGEEGVAQASPAVGILERAALRHVILLRFGRAAVADAAVRTAERDAQIAEVAAALAGAILGRGGVGALELDDLEGEAGG